MSVKTDNSHTLVNALEEIEALKLANRDLQHWFDDARAEAERLRGRVSELEAAIRYASDYLDASQLNAIGHGSKAHWEMKSALNGSVEKPGGGDAH